MLCNGRCCVITIPQTTALSTTHTLSSPATFSHNHPTITHSHPPFRPAGYVRGRLAPAVPVGAGRRGAAGGLGELGGAGDEEAARRRERGGLARREQVAPRGAMQVGGAHAGDEAGIADRVDVNRGPHRPTAEAQLRRPASRHSELLSALLENACGVLFMQVSSASSEIMGWKIATCGEMGLSAALRGVE